MLYLWIAFLLGGLVGAAIVMGVMTRIISDIKDDLEEIHARMTNEVR